MELYRLCTLTSQNEHMCSMYQYLSNYYPTYNAQPLHIYIIHSKLPRIDIVTALTHSKLQNYHGMHVVISFKYT